MHAGKLNEEVNQLEHLESYGKYLKKDLTLSVPFTTK